VSLETGSQCLRDGNLDPTQGLHATEAAPDMPLFAFARTNSPARCRKLQSTSRILCHRRGIKRKPRVAEPIHAVRFNCVAPSTSEITVLFFLFFFFRSISQEAQAAVLATSAASSPLPDAVNPAIPTPFDWQHTMCQSRTLPWPTCACFDNEYSTHWLVYCLHFFTATMLP